MARKKSHSETIRPLYLLGEVFTPNLTPLFTSKTCRIKDCTRQSYMNGFCKRHNDIDWYLKLAESKNH